MKSFDFLHTKIDNAFLQLGERTEKSISDELMTELTQLELTMGSNDVSEVNFQPLVRLVGAIISIAMSCRYGNHTAKCLAFYLDHVLRFDTDSLFTLENLLRLIDQQWFVFGPWDEDLEKLMSVLRTEVLYKVSLRLIDEGVLRKDGIVGLSIS